MSHSLREDLHADLEEIGTNNSSNPSFDSVLAARMSRRDLLKGSFGLAASSFIGMGAAACSSSNSNDAMSLNFEAVAKNRLDAVTVPAGYTASVLYRLGDPIAAGVAAYRNDGTDPAASHAQRAGDHHDGMHWFGMGSTGTYNASASDRGLLVMNHEAITPSFLHPTGQTIVGGVRTVADEVMKEFHVHGVSVIEVTKNGNAVAYVQGSSYNRRVTTLTEMMLAGPAARTPAMITKFSTDGSRTRGTVNNCANGYTPWGTYLLSLIHI